MASNLLGDGKAPPRAFGGGTAIVARAMRWTAPTTYVVSVTHPLSKHLRDNPGDRAHVAPIDRRITLKCESDEPKWDQRTFVIIVESETEREWIGRRAESGTAGIWPKFAWREVKP